MLARAAFKLRRLRWRWGRGESFAQIAPGANVLQAPPWPPATDELSAHRAERLELKDECLPPGRPRSGSNFGVPNRLRHT